MSNLLIVLSSDKITSDISTRGKPLFSFCEEKGLCGYHRVIEVVPFVKYIYRIKTDANIEKNALAKTGAPELYAMETAFFNRLRSVIAKLSLAGVKVALCQTFMGEDLNSKYFHSEYVPLDIFDREELSFEFNVAYVFGDDNRKA